MNGSLVQDLLERALKAVDGAATAVPDTPEGRERLIVELGVARHSLRAALSQIAVLSRDSASSLLSYFESTEFVDRQDAGPHVWYVVVPLPIARRIEVASLVRDIAPTILKLVLETINDGHIDDPWMHPGDFDWEEHPNYAEVSIVRGRQRRPQSLIVSTDGVVAVRDSGVVRGHYPVSVYQAMLETTLHFAYRFYQSLDLQMSQVAVQTNIANASELKMDIMHGIGTAWYRLPDSPRSIAIPAEPMVVAPTALRECGPVVAAAFKALTAAATTETASRRHEE